jgi:hypothetical protein
VTLAALWARLSTAGRVAAAFAEVGPYRDRPQSCPHAASNGAGGADAECGKESSDDHDAGRFIQVELTGHIETPLHRIRADGHSGQNTTRGRSKQCHPDERQAPADTDAREPGKR